jgi:hypothetical protein
MEKKMSYPKTAKFYDFNIDSQPDFSFEYETEFSSALVTLNGARYWAQVLLNCNPNANVVKFRSVGGWKIYTFNRGDTV